jgi:hypothetical protein
MKVLVTTSNNYLFLLEPYYKLFNKYWPGQEIIFLGFDASNVPSLPENCTFHSLGRQEDFGKIWTDPLIPYINSIKDEYFIVTVEDMMLMKPIDVNKMRLLEDEIKTAKADKALLDSHLNIYTVPHKEGLVKLKQEAPYRTTLHPCIWRKEYFKRYLKPGYSAWDFELVNMGESQTDGATIISLDQEKNLFESANVYRKGIPIPRKDCHLIYGCSGYADFADIEMILEHIKKNKGPQE